MIYQVQIIETAYKELKKLDKAVINKFDKAVHHFATILLDPILKS
jgi:mRNA-degrading endonuclease RelE of RelBE toxin-antitoxin system